MIFHLLEFTIHIEHIPIYPILYRSLSPGTSPFRPAAGGNVTTGAGTSPSQQEKSNENRGVVWVFFSGKMMGF